MSVSDFKHRLKNIYIPRFRQWCNYQSRIQIILTLPFINTLQFEALCFHKSGDIGHNFPFVQGYQFGSCLFSLVFFLCSSALTCADDQVNALASILFPDPLLILLDNYQTAQQRPSDKSDKRFTSQSKQETAFRKETCAVKLASFVPPDTQTKRRQNIHIGSS